MGRACREPRGGRATAIRRGGAALLLVAALLACLEVPAAAEERARHRYEGAAGSRAYEVLVPPGPVAPRPLVVFLHGCDQDAPDIAAGSRFDDLALARGFIVAYPEQDPEANGSRCWNWFLPEHQVRGRGEPAIIAGIVDEIASLSPVDPARVHVAGISAGGAMAVVLGATYPDRFASIAVHAGCAYRALPCLGAPSAVPVEQSAAWAHEAMGERARVVPVFAVQGEADLTVPPQNTEQVVQQWLGTDDLADDGVENGSTPREPTSTTTGQVPGGHAYSIDRYADTTGCVLAERWLVAGMGHAYAGGDPDGSYTDPLGPDVTAASYRFFEEHPMPTGPGCSAQVAGSAGLTPSDGTSDGSRTGDPPDAATLPATGGGVGLALPAALAAAGLAAVHVPRGARSRRHGPSRPPAGGCSTRRTAPCPAPPPR